MGIGLSDTRYQRLFLDKITQQKLVYCSDCFNINIINEEDNLDQFYFRIRNINNDFLNNYVGKYSDFYDCFPDNTIKLSAIPILTKEIIDESFEKELSELLSKVSFFTREQDILLRDLFLDHLPTSPGQLAKMILNNEIRIDQFPDNKLAFPFLSENDLSFRIILINIFNSFIEQEISNYKIKKTSEESLLTVSSMFHRNRHLIFPIILSSYLEDVLLDASFVGKEEHSQEIFLSRSPSSPPPLPRTLFLFKIILLLYQY